MKRIALSLVILVVGMISCNEVKAQAALKLMKQKVFMEVKTQPEGAKVYYDGELVCSETPGVVEIWYSPKVMPGKKKSWSERKNRSEKSNPIRLTFKKEGYKTCEKVIYPDIEQLGLAKYYVSYPSIVHQKMELLYDESDPTVRKDKLSQKVSRDAAGKTDLEKTVIRWYFETEPQGARIFWRVISSVPAEVKNTNELWLGNTPFEETRSFNIPGLSYENSRNVQIEIKVKRNGYLDQTKRFNVRQAIDQQEISSFFDMIKAETSEE